MRKTSLTMLFLTALFYHCNPKSETQTINLNGEWDWVYTRGHENGESFNVSPQNMNMTVKYIFDRGNVIIFVNDQENERYAYYMDGDTLRYGKEEVLFETRSDTLFLRNTECCADVFEKAFIQKKYEPN